MALEEIEPTPETIGVGNKVLEVLQGCKFANEAQLLRVIRTMKPEYQEEEILLAVVGNSLGNLVRKRKLRITYTEGKHRGNSTPEDRYYFLL